MTRTPIKKRILPDYTRGEEIFNMISHIVGGAFAISALVLCVIMAVVKGNVWGVVSGSIYGGTMIILYTMSSIYHGLIPETAKKVMQAIDHCAVFLLIAGTYTPLTLCILRPDHPGVAWTVFGCVWGLAILGIVLNAIDLKAFRIFSMICYLGTGWFIIIAMKPLIQELPTGGLIFLFGGGVFYTLGAVLYGLGKKVRYMHSVFHLFVLAGSIMHFFCVLFYAMPFVKSLPGMSV